MTARTYLPADFWTTTPTLDLIDEAAACSHVAPDGVLANCMGRAAAQLAGSHLSFGDTTPIAWMPILFGASGSGKSVANRAGRRLLPARDHSDDLYRAYGSELPIRGGTPYWVHLHPVYVDRLTPAEAAAGQWAHTWPSPDGRRADFGDPFPERRISIPEPGLFLVSATADLLVRHGAAEGRRAWVMRAAALLAALHEERAVTAEYAAMAVVLDEVSRAVHREAVQERRAAVASGC